ncbi:MAG TPA: HAMP domain-containing sensor histidine kinase [Nannocystaceae bacterium]|nr:HAMP domain-containing sensor histidine kinase [Nannocystaceae bacterium]
MRTGRHGFMRRALLVWFGATILLTGITVGITHRLLEPEHRTWAYSMQRIEQFASGEFARVWDDPSARDDLAARAARDLDVRVELFDEHDRSLGAYGPTCSMSHSVGADVFDGDERLGRVTACWSYRRPSIWPMIGTLVVALATLWWAAGILARRLTHPLERLASFAHRLAGGDLDARVGAGKWRRGELGQLATALDDMAATVARQIGEGRELLAAVSHEIRTPLAHLRVLIELMRDSGADPQAIAELERELFDIDALVGKLLADARLQFSAASFTPLDAGELALRALSQAALPTSVLDVDDTHGLELTGDPTLLSRALANLLENADAHGGGVVKLRVQSDDDEIRFSVDDDGTGFTDDEIAHAFEPFVRGKGGSRPGQAALGLGLALVQRIAIAHGGEAWAENRVGGGATVGFTIARRPRSDASLSSA